MRKFWGFYDNGQYRVGCNGAAMYLYDANNRELAKFKDIPYAYRGAFKPGSNIFVLRSTEGRIAIYDCDERKLLRKFRFSGIDNSQDEGFCFSPDGKYFLNIEKYGSNQDTRLSIYETQDFTPVKCLFGEEKPLALGQIEYNVTQNQYYVLLFMRDEKCVYKQGYICVLSEDQLAQRQPISSREYTFMNSYKSLQISGFTEKAIQWSGLHYAGYTDEEILKLRDRNISMFSFLKIAPNIMK